MPAMPNWWMPPAVGGSITAAPNQSLGTPKSNNPIPQNWMQVISDLMNKPQSAPTASTSQPWSNWYKGPGWIEALTPEGGFALGRTGATTPITQTPSMQPPASSATNTGINNALQKLISGFGGGAATAQPTQMPSWWNTGRSVYPWGRGSTF